MYMFGEKMVSRLISKGRFPGKPPPGVVVKCMEALFMPMMTFQVVPGSKEFGETYAGTMKPTVTPEEFEFARFGLNWSSSLCTRLCETEEALSDRRVMVGYATDSVACAMIVRQMSPACFGQGINNTSKTMRRALLKNIRRDVPTAFIIQHSGRSDDLAELAEFIKSNFTIKYLLNSFIPGNPLSAMGPGTIMCAWLSFPDEIPPGAQPLRPFPNTAFVKAPKTPDVVLKWDGEVIKTGALAAWLSNLESCYSSATAKSQGLFGLSRPRALARAIAHIPSPSSWPYQLCTAEISPKRALALD